MNTQDVREIKQIIADLRSGSNREANEIIKQRTDSVIEPIKSNPITQLLTELGATDYTEQAVGFLFDHDMQAQEDGMDCLYKMVESRVIAEYALEIHDHRKDYRGAA
ncbi:hypothetical protein [Rosenbergiella metrosideri]|uniref:hypothetical protein n=1 Tax=Rosenbergiella metrosideri TaxID=2921185 RepID=UPI001F4F87D4|nr:hypothetical protein [Rosenbergiella metrosideri]